MPKDSPGGKACGQHLGPCFSDMAAATKKPKRPGQAKQAIRNSLDFFFKVFHSNILPMAITTLVEGMIIEANEAAAKLIGFTQEELSGGAVLSHDIWVDQKQCDEVLMRDRLTAILTKHGISVTN